MISIKSTGQDTQMVREIKKNENAPYAGVLVPQSTFRDMKASYENDHFLMEKMDDIASPCIVDNTRSNDILMVVLISVVGVISGMALEHNWQK